MISQRDRELLGLVNQHLCEAASQVAAAGELCLALSDATALVRSRLHGPLRLVHRAQLSVIAELLDLLECHAKTPEPAAEESDRQLELPWGEDESDSPKAKVVH